MTLELLDEQLGQGFDGRFVFRIADVEDPAVAAVALVFDDAEQAFDAVFDVGKAALLLGRRPPA